jgi:hypothetical protein
MKKLFFSFAIVAAVVFSACNSKTEEVATEEVATEEVATEEVAAPVETVVDSAAAATTDAAATTEAAK